MREGILFKVAEHLADDLGVLHSELVYVWGVSEHFAASELRVSEELERLLALARALAKPGNAPIPRGMVPAIPLARLWAREFEAFGVSEPAMVQAVKRKLTPEWYRVGIEYRIKVASWPTFRNGTGVKVDRVQFVTPEMAVALAEMCFPRQTTTDHAAFNMAAMRAMFAVNALVSPEEAEDGSEPAPPVPGSVDCPSCGEPASIAPACYADWGSPVVMQCPSCGAEFPVQRGLAVGGV